MAPGQSKSTNSELGAWFILLIAHFWKVKTAKWWKIKISIYISAVSYQWGEQINEHVQFHPDSRHLGNTDGWFPGQASRQREEWKWNCYLCTFLPVVIKLRVSRLRIWVAVIHIVAGIRVLNKDADKLLRVGCVWESVWYVQVFKNLQNLKPQNLSARKLLKSIQDIIFNSKSAVYSVLIVCLFAAAITASPWKT